MSSNTKVISGNNCFSFLSEWLNEKQYHRVVLVADENTGKCCLPLLLNQLPVLSNFPVYFLPEGEKAKATEPLLDFLSFLALNDTPVNSLVISLGGGAVSDLAGFASSVYKRGIDIIHIPTSLIAMLDAAYGGKTGINFLGIKNIIGTYYFPSAVLIFSPFLQSLPAYHLQSGFGEMLKYALLIGGDIQTRVLEAIQKKQIPHDDLIYQCLQYKMDVVLKDPLEKKERFFLNLGHTAGHAFEAAALERKVEISHGQAVAAGIHLALNVSENMTGFPQSLAKELRDFIEENFPLDWLKNLPPSAIRKFILQDKKNLGRGIRMVLLEDVGKPVLIDQIQPDYIMSLLS